MEVHRRSLDCSCQYAIFLADSRFVLLFLVHPVFQWHVWVCVCKIQVTTDSHARYSGLLRGILLVSCDYRQQKNLPIYCRSVSFTHFVIILSGHFCCRSALCVCVFFTFYFSCFHVLRLPMHSTK